MSCPPEEPPENKSGARSAAELNSYQHELCKLIRGWLVASYCAMDQEIHPLLRELSESFVSISAEAQKKMLKDYFGAQTASLEEIYTKLDALTQCFHSLLVGTLIPEKPKKNNGGRGDKNHG